MLQIDAIRYDRDGDGRADGPCDLDAYAAAFPHAVEGDYQGYELARSLDFEDPGGYESGEVERDWGRGWDPTGAPHSDNSFRAVFEGNGHAIAKLFIYREDEGHVGLFSELGQRDSEDDVGEIRNLGLVDADVTAFGWAGGLVGYVHDGANLIHACYLTGDVSISLTAYNVAGGLASRVGKNASVVASYVDVDVAGYSVVDGLVGNNNGIVIASYAAGSVEATNLAGVELIGINRSTAEVRAGYVANRVRSGNSVGALIVIQEGGVIENSYWDADKEGDIPGIGDGSSSGAQGKTTEQLKKPKGYTGIYADWNIDLDGDGVAEDP